MTLPQREAPHKHNPPATGIHGFYELRTGHSLMAMESDEKDMTDSGKIGRGILARAVPSLSFITGTVRILFEEVSMGFPVFSIVKTLSAVVDPNMAVWIAVIMVAGYWLKRMRRPQWLPSLPVLLLALFLAVGFAFGWMQNTYDGWKGVAWVMAYGIGNGIFFTGMSFIVYDIGHGTLKKARARKKEGEVKG